MHLVQSRDAEWSLCGVVLRSSWNKKLVKLYQSSYTGWCDSEIDRSRFLEIINYKIVFISKKTNILPKWLAITFNTISKQKSQELWNHNNN
jgi:hypothetical protein